MKSDAMDALRKAILTALAVAGRRHDYVTAPQLAEMLGISGESQMQILRRRLHELTRRGELEKTGQGQWKHTGKAPVARGQGYQKMWRAIRTARGSFTALEVVQYSSQDRSFVSKYLRFLENSELIRHSGKNGNSPIFSLTAAGREQRETPYPDKDIPDPYQKERAATATLCRILMLDDIDAPRARRNIREHLTVLNNRFMEEEAHAEQ
jgi:hypothetical protein